MADVLRTRPYTVEVEREGCRECGEGKQWEVYDSKGIGVGGTTFGVKEEAEWLAGLLNDAHEEALAGDPRHGWEP